MLGNCSRLVVLLLAMLLTTPGLAPAQDISIGGFIPYVGLGMTDEFKTIDSVSEEGFDLGGTFFISDAEFSISPTANQLGTNGTPYYDIALLDTGAATHIITQQAYQGFDIEGFNLTGTAIQEVGGATGVLEMVVNDAAGVYVAGLGDRTSTGQTLTMDKNALRGQSSFATLTAPEEWTLPNIIGLPMAMHHSIAIRNSDPQVFEHKGRTLRTPQIDFIDVGTGADEGIIRRADINIRPGIGFVQGPFYVYNLDFEDLLNSQLGGSIAFHDNPASPTVVQDQTGTGGSLFLDVDLEREGIVKQEREFLFDTGADITVISQTMAKRLGFDAVLDTPDFILEVEGSGGVASGVPGIFLDELNIVTVGGDFTVHNVPVAILDVTDVSDPGNVLDGIIGTNVFNGRDLVIDASPSLGAGGAGPSLYISDPVTIDHIWSTTAASASWHTANNWSANAVPDLLATAEVVNLSGADQTATVSQDALANTLLVAGHSGAAMTLKIDSGATLTTFGETKIEQGGVIDVAAGSKLDTQFMNIEQGTLRGSGEVFSGTGPITTPVRNINGRIEPGDGIGRLSIDGDLSNLESATIAFELNGLVAGLEHDQLDVSRYAFLGGTLEVTLADGYTPEVNDAFTLITTGEEVQGMFNELMLPAGFEWDVNYNANNLVLSVLGLAQPLEGDFNGDGHVNLADYTVWRDNLGGLYDTSHYTQWKNNFGLSAPSASFTQSAKVPEPTAVILLLTAASAVFARRCLLA